MPRAKKAAGKQRLRRRKRRPSEKFDQAMGHAAFALTQALLDELLFTGMISTTRIDAVFEAAQGKLYDLPSFATAVSMLEEEHAARERTKTRSH
jgi:hypothetical protein